MQPVIKKIWFHIVTAVMAMSIFGTAHADAYPSHPIRLIVPFSAGAGVTDIMARLVAKYLSQSLGQPVIVENRPGASGIPGTGYVRQSAPDGYTLLVTNVSFAVNSFLYAKLPYDALKDFTPVALINTAPLLLVVNPNVPAHSVKELISYAKAHPGQLNFASGGVGTTPYLAGELFASLAGINVVQVPYKGGAPALSDLISGQVSFMLENVPGTMPFVKAGKLRALAITSKNRSSLAPNLPTMIEAGVPGYEVIGWNAIFARKGTPEPIVKKLNIALAKIMQKPEVKKMMIDLGAEPINDTPEQVGAFFSNEMNRWGAVIKGQGVQPQ